MRSTLGADPVHRLQCGDPVLDCGQNLGSEASDQLVRQNRPDPFHQAATQVSLDPCDRGWPVCRGPLQAEWSWDSAKPRAWNLFDVVDCVCSVTRKKYT